MKPHDRTCSQRTQNFNSRAPYVIELIEDKKIMVHQLEIQIQLLKEQIQQDLKAKTIQKHHCSLFKDFSDMINDMIEDMI